MREIKKDVSNRPLAFFPGEEGALRLAMRRRNEAGGIIVEQDLFTMNDQTRVRMLQKRISINEIDDLLALGR